jgi:hypothetical protein
VSIRQKFHADTGRKIECWVGANQAPGTEQPGGGHATRGDESGTNVLISNLRLAVACLLLPLQALVAQPATVDHQPFDALLQQHVVRGFVDYDAIGRAPAFSRYLTTLERARVDSLDEDTQLAFWLNVYNAYTIQLIVTHRETASIRNINKSLGVMRLKGPWSEPLVRAAGRTLSLDEVFHSILRKRFAEPRIHFAVACGAVGCAPLRSEAYTGAKLLDQLNDQGRAFLRDTTKNRIERNRAMLSPVLMVYRNDFGATRQDLERFIAPWFDGAERARLTKGTYILQSTTFDWSLNSQAIGRSRGLL